jgi:hypothetical protein
MNSAEVFRRKSANFVRVTNRRTKRTPFKGGVRVRSPCSPKHSKRTQANIVRQCAPCSPTPRRQNWNGGRNASSTRKKFRSEFSIDRGGPSQRAALRPTHGYRVRAPIVITLSKRAFSTCVASVSQATLKQGSSPCRQLPRLLREARIFPLCWGRMENAARSSLDRARLAPRPIATPTARSRVTNGRLLGEIDGRSATARRYRDLIAALIAEHGSEPTISELSTIRAAAALIVKGEQLQCAIVRGDSVAADEVVRLSSEARRLLVGLQRKRGRARDAERPSLSEYLAQHYAEASEGARLAASNADPAPEAPSEETRTSEAPNGSGEEPA